MEDSAHLTQEVPPPSCLRCAGGGQRSVLLIFQAAPGDSRRSSCQHATKGLTAEGAPAECFQRVSGQLGKEHGN